MCTFSFNVGEMSDLVKLCDNLKIPALTVGEGWDYKTDDITKDHLIANNIEITHHHIKEAAREAKKRGIIFRTRFPSLNNKQFKDIPYHAGCIKPRNCLNLYSAAWFLPNFDVIACSSATKSFGNINNTDFAKIWNSDKFGYVQSRLEFRKNQIPFICNDCIYTGSFFS
jgi:MoaA/NifB/PqqE/SkfB family radical SAM enzyme